MDTIRMHQEDQENRIAVELARARAKENYTVINTQQQKRAVLGILHNNCARNVTKPEIHKDENNIKPKTYIFAQQGSHKIFENKPELNFKIYEDDSEKNIYLSSIRDLKEKKEVKIEIVQENIARSDINHDRLDTDIDISVKSRVAFINNYKELQIQNKHDDDLCEDSPMSLAMSAEKPVFKPRKELNQRESRNEKDFFEVAEYRNDVISYLRETEVRHRSKPGYMRKQPDITYSMRSILVDWLVEVAQEYQLHNATLYLAVSYIDRFLSYMSVVRSKLQLVGAAAMYIAAKYEEVYPPNLKEFVYITDDTYTKTQVARMEGLILRVLAFDLTVPTVLDFLSDICINHKLSDKIKFLAMYLYELSLLEADPYLQYLPSHLAASAIALARHTLHEEIWPDEIELTTGYSLATLSECISHLNNTFCNASKIQQQAIQEKYKSSTYGHVSLLLPRSTIPCEDEEESA